MNMEPIGQVFHLNATNEAKRAPWSAPDSVNEKVTGDNLCKAFLMHCS